MPALTAATSTKAAVRRRRKRLGTSVVASATFEPVADTADRRHVRRLLRHLELVAQPLDGHVDQPGVPEVVVAPDALEEDLPGEDAPRVPDELCEQPELDRRESD